jgi:hypothetical protein
VQRVGGADLGGMAESAVAREIGRLEQEVRALERQCGSLRASISAAAWLAAGGVVVEARPARWPGAGVLAADGAGVLGFVTGGVTGVVASIVLAMALR